MTDEEDAVDAILAIAAGIAVAAGIAKILEMLKEQNNQKKW